jgi:predicted nucleic acid-binding protein
VLLTEDLQHGMDLDGVRVTDPFLTAPGDPG